MSQVTVNQPAVCNDSATVTHFVYQRFEVNTASKTIDTDNCMYGVTYTGTGAVTLTLPPVSSNQGMKIGICDEGGNASANNITINADVGDTIIGVTSVKIDGDYNSINLYNDGTSQWFIC